MTLLLLREGYLLIVYQESMIVSMEYYPDFLHRVHLYVHLYVELYDDPHTMEQSSVGNVKKESYTQHL